MEQIFSKILKLIIAAGIVYCTGKGFEWLTQKYLLKYSNRDPITIEISHTLSDGGVILERFIQGTSIKHGLTKKLDKNANIVCVANYYYGVLLEKMELQTRNSFWLDTIFRNLEVVEDRENGKNNNYKDN